jgi:peptidoglycan/LPS O-acetylase OafA/YrhL
MVALTIWTASESPGHVAAEAALALSYTTDFFIGGWHPAWELWLKHTWSLGVEEQFYLIWPVLLVALAGRPNLKRNVLVLAAGLALVPFSALVLGPSAVQYTPLGAAFQLIAGAALAIVPIRVPRGTWIGTVAAFALIWALKLVPSQSDALQCGPVQIFAAASVLLVAWAIQHQPRVLRIKPLVWLGRRSYGFYLYHLPLITAFQFEIARRSEQIVAAFVASLILTAASYRWIEKPFLRLKSRYARAVAPRS